MTLLALSVDQQATSPAAARPSRATRILTASWLWLALIASGQVALAVRPGLNTAPFEDEGLYVFLGHRMIEHLLHGTVVTEYPGSYLSGAPGFYPVLAAVGDAIGGLQGARTVSLLFAILAMVGVYGLGQQLYGKLAGLLAALSFALSGSVIYLSHFATFDSLTMALVAAAAWLVVYSAKHDRLLWAPGVGALLCAAFLAKYAGAAYAPVVAALGIAVGWPLHRWVAVQRGLFILLSGVIMAYFVIELWGTDIIAGIRSTTSSRVVLNYASRNLLVSQVVRWVGPWLALAIVGGLARLRRQWPVVIVLFAGSVIGPLDQIRIHEATSLDKHVAFGLVFAAPLIGDVLARCIRKLRPLAVPLVAAIMALFLGLGLHFSGQFLTGWVQDTNLLPALRTAIAASPHKAILGEEPSPERYELGGLVKPLQWTDTFAFYYAGKQGERAYVEAIDQSHFGVIYLTLGTPYGRFVHQYLSSRDTPYHLVDVVPRYLRGKAVGAWLVYTPKVVAIHPANTLRVGPTLPTRKP